ncbi:hypothetical protein [Prochlorococcus marinus]|nr:hypothetical protein [Prochlorococcus marinus]
MIISEFCGGSINREKRKIYFQQRKLEMLSYYRDSLERRIAAINASIETLKIQIDRDTLNVPES